MAHPEIRVVDCPRHNHLRQAGRTRGGQPTIACGIDAVDDKIREFMRCYVDDTNEFARRCQAFERLAAGARGVEQDDFVAQGFKAFGHTSNASGGAAERGDSDQRRLLYFGLSLRGALFDRRRHRERGILHHRLGDPVERNVADRGIHGDIALRDVPLHGRRASHRTDHHLGHEVGHCPQDRADEISSVRST